MKIHNDNVFSFKNMVELAAFFLETLKNALEKKDVFSIALSGGSTPLPLYREIARAPAEFPWDIIHIFQVDERFVPHGHPDSNYGALRQHLLEKIPVPECNIHPVPIGESPSRAAWEYEEEIKTFFRGKGEGPARFNLIMLGLGEDGHTASLFPYHNALQEKHRLTLPVQGLRFTHNRITLTLPVINQADMILFVVKGKEKASIIKEVVEDRNPRYPASLVHSTRGKTLFLLDDQAASLLGYSPRVK